MLNVEHREYLRRAVIAILAGAPTVRFSIPVLLERTRERLPDVTHAEMDVLEALAFLEGLFLVKPVENDLGASKRWQITAMGTQFHERNP